MQNERQDIKQAVLSSLDFSRETPDEELYTLIDNHILHGGDRRFLTVGERKRLRKDVFASIRELDILQPLIDDPRVTEIMVNGPEDIFVERDGHISRYEGVFSSPAKLMDVIQQIVAGCNRVVNEASPIADARLADGARANVVLEPVSVGGSALTIRRFPVERITMNKLVSFGALTPYLASYLQALVRAGYNIFISGGTGSGKTTFLNALSDYVPDDERVITIEDNAELQITHVPNIVRMEVRKANVEGCAEITMRDLIKTSLRMRPSRIIVGEVRGEEVIDMLQAMNTGHDGSMSTGHANSARDMLTRLETMYLFGMDSVPLSAVRGQIASGIDIIVHLGRLRDKTRKVLEIREVTGGVDYTTGEIRTHALFSFREEKTNEDGKIIGYWKKEEELQSTYKLKASGICLPPDERGSSGCSESLIAGTGDQ